MKALRGALLLAAVALALLIVYAWQIEPRQFRVTRLIPPPRLAEALAGERVVFLADLHLVRGWRKADRLLRMLTELKPDALLIGGDLVQYDESVDPVIDWLKRLPVKTGAFAVLGDSDYTGRVRNCAYCHVPGKRELRRDLPVRFLRNETAALAGGRVRLVGLDAEDRAGWPAACGPGPDVELPTILLAHYPTAAAGLDCRADLILAGDTHGGQVALPGPLLNRLAHENLSPYRAGWFQLDGKPLFVTRGVGEGYFPVRFLTPPEIVVLGGGS